MDSAEVVHRWHFAFTATYHYLFPQLTMGLALLIVLMKGIGLRTGDAHWDRSARFWTRIFAVNFAMGVVTGIPLEFQFGTNWAGFSRATGGVIGQTLALEGVFAFFLESSLLGLVLFGERKLGPRWHFRAAVGLWFGTWLSGFFIVTTNAWMQRPVGYEQDAAGILHLTSLSAVLLNPWGLWAWVHAMLGAVTTAGFFVASIGAYYLLVGRHEAYGRSFVRLAVWVLLPTTVLQAFPTGDRQARLVHDHQPAAFAGMEGHFDTPQGGAPLVLIGQPDMDRLRIDNPVRMPNVLSFLTHKSWDAPVRGLKEFPRDTWPDNIPLLYYAYHLMVGLGTLFIALAAVSAWKLRRGTLFSSRPLLWALLLALPFPYIANTAGWMAAELGRQPWVVYGVLRTSAAYSTNVSAGNAMFSLLGFFGIYSVLSALFLLLVVRKIAAGPEPAPGEAPGGFGDGPARPEA